MVNRAEGADQDAILLCAKTLEQTCGKDKFLVGTVLVRTRLFPEFLFEVAISDGM